MNIGPNTMASIHYIEGVKFTDGSNVGHSPSTDYPFSFEHVQHEHALVTVGDDFRIIWWDQYGGDAEQNCTDEASQRL